MTLCSPRRRRRALLVFPRLAPFLLFAGAVAAAAVCLAPPAARAQTAPVPVAARRVSEFLASIGANSAVSRRGETLAETARAAGYLGLAWIRAGYESDIPVEDLIDLHRRTGVRFSYGLMSGGTDIARLLGGARKLAAAGALVALEGPNEPNNWGVTYQGQAGGGRAPSWMAVARLQRDLYRAVKSDPALKAYPVWSLSENGAQKDNVGLQFLTIPRGANCLMPDGTKFADFANAHNYLYHPNAPGLEDNKAWNAADPTPACKVDGLYGNYGLTWAKKFPGYSVKDLLTLPRVTTETGTTIGGVVTEEIHALNLLSLYLAQFKRGWSHTAVYLLRDRSDEGGNQQFGFYKPDYTPRKAALYLHNLTTVLAERGDGDRRAPTKTPAKAPGKLAYAIPDQPATVHDLLLQKRDGTFALVVWGERVTGSDRVTVRLGKAHPSVRVYDPTVGTAPVRTLSNVSSLTLTLSDHPLVVELPERAAPARTR